MNKAHLAEVGGVWRCWPVTQGLAGPEVQTHLSYIFPLFFGSMGQFTPVKPLLPGETTEQTKRLVQLQSHPQLTILWGLYPQFLVGQTVASLA